MRAAPLNEFLAKTRASRSPKQLPGYRVVRACTLTPRQRDEDEHRRAIYGFIKRRLLQEFGVRAYKPVAFFYSRLTAFYATDGVVHVGVPLEADNLLDACVRRPGGRGDRGYNRRKLRQKYMRYLARLGLVRLGRGVFQIEPLGLRPAAPLARLVRRRAMPKQEADKCILTGKNHDLPHLGDQNALEVLSEHRKALGRRRPPRPRGPRGRFCRQLDPDPPPRPPSPSVVQAPIPPAPGVRWPAVPAAEYGVRPIRLDENRSLHPKEAIMADKAPSVGPRAGESWQAYLQRVSAEQEGRLRDPAVRARRQAREAWLKGQRERADRVAADEARRAAQWRERLRAEAMAKLEAKMLASGNVRLFIDPGKPWGEQWLYAARQRVPDLTAKTVPAGLGVGALDYGLDELARAQADGRRVDNPAGFVIDLARRVMRRERWRWGTERDALAQPHLVVPLNQDGRPMATLPLRVVAPPAVSPRRAGRAPPQVEFSQ